MSAPEHETVVILDFGSQYSQLIARRVRELGVYSEIKPFHLGLDELKELNPNALILSGGPSSVYAPDAPLCDPRVFSLGIPMLAICYGMQLMARERGGTVARSNKAEYGPTDFFPDRECPLFSGVPERLRVWMSHGDRIEALPPGFRGCGSSTNAPVAAFWNAETRQFGLQFHPEVTHTRNGREIIDHFLKDICGLKKDWSMAFFVDQAVESIRETTRGERVLCGLSGGVDSTVASVLLHRAIGDRLICVFVDNGLLRKDERKKVESVFLDRFKINLHVVDARERFLSRLKGVIDPETKRKIIGHTFIDVFDEYARRFENIRFLAQGTLYPDVIESVSPRGGPSATIKTHHNVGGLPQKMNLKLIEPFRELFKDEVREVGRLLDLPEENITRQPFPGPGLAVRILGEVDQASCDRLREADAIVIDEVKKAGIYEKIWQSFAILLPLKTVGVMGDDRTYDNVIAVRAVESLDGMTAHWVELPYDLLSRISNRIINEVSGVNRVVYDISSKPPATIEWE
jgi:GMP synthase (glutamine-hydrolysing)